MSCSWAALAISSSASPPSPEPARHRRRERVHPARVLVELRLLGVHRAQQDFARPGSRAAVERARLLAYIRSSAIWSARSACVRLLGQEHDAERGAHRELRAGLGQRGGGPRDQLIRRHPAQVQVSAELIAAESIRLPHSVHRSLQPASETREQLVAGQVAERVVVVLEAVEVEQQEQRGAAVRPRPRTRGSRSASGCGGCPDRSANRS